MSNKPFVRQVPPPQGGATSVHARFIPREEVQSFAAWNLGSLNPQEETAAKEPAPPSSEEIQAGQQAARMAGYQDGYRDGLVALEGFKQSFAMQATSQVGALIASFDDRLAALEAQMAESLAAAATQIARQVVRTELRTHPELVAVVAREAVASLLLSARHVTLQVHPDDLPLVLQGASDELERRGARAVANPTLARGGCLVESDVGAVDAQIETLWRHAAAQLGDDSVLGALDDAPRRIVLRDDAPA